MNYIKVTGIAMGMSSSILGVAYFAYLLKENGHISNNVAMFLILAAIAINFFWMIRYAIKKSD